MDCNRLNVDSTYLGRAYNVCSYANTALRLGKMAMSVSNPVQLSLTAASALARPLAAYTENETWITGAEYITLGAALLNDAPTFLVSTILMKTTGYCRDIAWKCLSEEQQNSTFFREAGALGYVICTDGAKVAGINVSQKLDQHQLVKYLAKQAVITKALESGSEPDFDHPFDKVDWELNKLIGSTSKTSEVVSVFEARVRDARSGHIRAEWPLPPLFHQGEKEETGTQTQSRLVNMPVAILDAESFIFPGDIHHHINQYLSFRDNANLAQTSHFHYKVHHSVGSWRNKLKNIPQVENKTAAELEQLFKVNPPFRLDKYIPCDQAGLGALNSLGIDMPRTIRKIANGEQSIEEVLELATQLVNAIQAAGQHDPQLLSLNSPGVIKCLVEGVLTDKQVFALHRLHGGTFLPDLLNNENVRKYLYVGLLKPENLELKGVINLTCAGVCKCIDNDKLTVEKAIRLTGRRIENLDEEGVQKYINNKQMNILQAIWLRESDAKYLSDPVAQDLISSYSADTFLGRFALRQRFFGFGDAEA